MGSSPTPRTILLRSKLFSFELRRNRSYEAIPEFYGLDGEVDQFFILLMSQKSWSVYIIKCNDGKLYTGISNDVDRRVSEHNKGRGCKFTKCRWPVKLVYRKRCGTQSSARKRELEIQGLTRKKKLELISGPIV